MTILLTILYIVVCLFLIVVVLLQSGKAADLAGAFGGMGSQTAFGPRGAATVLSKATTIAAALFMVLSITLSIVATRNRGSAATVLDTQKSATKSDTKAGDQKGPGPTMTITPEGGDPSKSVTVPLPLPAEGEGKAGDSKGGATVQLPLPGQTGGGTPAGTPKQGGKK
ncbi:MAG: preprotein translocase subunit SecG [Bryobacteraceae bacterium]